MTVESTLSERGKLYGDFSDHASVAQSIQDAMRMTRPNGWDRLDDAKKQALTVIADKIARVISGDPEYADNWHDIQGYAKLVEDRLKPSLPAGFGQQHTIQPASAMQDDSPRMEVIGQNGEMAVEIYEAIDCLGRNP